MNAAVTHIDAESCYSGMAPLGFVGVDNCRLKNSRENYR